jgi:hypothetical protein
MGADDAGATDGAAAWDVPLFSDAKIDVPTDGGDARAEEDAASSEAGTNDGFAGPDGGDASVPGEDAPNYDGGPNDGFVGTDALAADVFTWDGEVSCQSLNDCNLPQRSMVPYCPGSAWGCIDQRCVWECQGPQVCTTAQQSLGCLSCDGTSLCASSSDCGPSSAVSARIDLATCTATAATPIAGLQVTVSPDTAQCAFRVDAQAGGELGVYYSANMGFPSEGGDYVYGFFPVLGGTCTMIRMDQFGASRIVVSCPACQFVLRFL